MKISAKQIDCLHNPRKQKEHRFSNKLERDVLSVFYFHAYSPKGIYLKFDDINDPNLFLI